MLEHSFIAPLCDCDSNSIAGGKAANLAQMIQAGIPVPDGFVITVEAFRTATDSGEKDLPEKLKQLILEQYRSIGSPLVAVRSSATLEDMPDASLAGQYATILDVDSEDKLLAAVTTCYSSINAERVTSYFKEHNIDTSNLAMAVIVQRLIPADTAGVIFTTNPQRNKADQMLIEAAFGLGEAVVSGAVQPDIIEIDNKTGETIEYTASNKDIWFNPATRQKEALNKDRRSSKCINPQNITDLWNISKEVVRHFGSAQDIEWAIHNHKVWILQSRPITTLGDDHALKDLARKTSEDLTARLKEGSGWVRHNISETLPRPTPATWSIVKRFMTGNGGFGRMYRSIGFKPSREVSNSGYLELIAGEVYMDIRKAPDMFFKDLPFSYDVNLLRSNPSAAQNPPTVSEGSFIQRYLTAAKLGKTNMHLKNLAIDYDRKFEEELVPAFIKWVKSEKPRDLSSLDNDQWHSLFKEREERVMDLFAPESLLPGMIGAMAIEELEEFVKTHFWKENTDELVSLLSTSDKADTTFHADALLYQVAIGKATIDEWLKHFGHRSPEEFDLATPRWNERPDKVRKMAELLKDANDPAAAHSLRVKASREKASALSRTLSSKEEDKFNALISLVHRYLRFREDGKHYLMMGYDLLRDMVLEAGRRLKLEDHVFMLTISEMRSNLDNKQEYNSIIDERIETRRLESHLNLPHVIASEEDAISIGLPIEISKDDCIAAFPISPGTASGNAAIVLKPENAHMDGKNYILVCPSTDPSWTPLFVNAAGLILERGGMLSHGAIVAREMGIPAVVVENATSLFLEGETLAIDGSNGLVLRNDSKAPLTVTQDPNNVLISKDMMPPAPGTWEKRSSTLTGVALLVWGAYLAGAFLYPGSAIMTSSLSIIDRILWPLIPSFGRVGTLALISGAFAMLLSILQRVMTDNERLLAVKNKSAKLRKSASSLPVSSPRRRVMENLAGAAQLRIMKASFVPLAAIIGVMVMIFVWLPTRINPGLWNASPGTSVDVIAEIDGEYKDTITAKAEQPLRIDEKTLHEQSIPPVRATLKELLKDLQNEMPLTGEAWEENFSALSSDERAASLEEYLAKDMPSSHLSWTVHTHPEKSGHFNINLISTDGTIPIQIVIGSRLIPGKTDFDINDESCVKSVRLIYHKQRVKNEQIFWAPLRSLGIKRDIGWLMTYIIFYLPFMLISRRLLGIP